MQSIANIRREGPNDGKTSEDPFDGPAEEDRNLQIEGLMPGEDGKAVGTGRKRVEQPTAWNFSKRS